MSPPRNSTRSTLDALTPRELQVLEVMATGARDREIAEQLGITVATVKLHLHHVYTKLNATNRVEATRHYLDKHKRRRIRSATSRRPA
jgi:DNA-binding NarL/FixJ family response regulator